jgi:ParB family chromosome partitioning protein
MMAEVAGATIASCQCGRKDQGAQDHHPGPSRGADGREKREGWVPRWMAFPPAAYTARGGVGTVDQAALAADASARRTCRGWA